MSYSCYNVSANYNNNTLEYSHDSGTTWKTVTSPNGNFSFGNVSGLYNSPLNQTII